MPLFSPWPKPPVSAPSAAGRRAATKCGWVKKYLCLFLFFASVYLILFALPVRYGGMQLELKQLLYPETWGWTEKEHNATLADAITATVMATRLWARLTLPVVASGVRGAADMCHKHPILPWIFGICFSVVLFTVLLQRECRRRRIYEQTNEKFVKLKDSYNGLIQTIGQKSRLFATLVPHLAFFATVLSLLYFFPGFTLAKLGDPVLFFFVGNVVPLVRGFYILHNVPESPRKRRLVFSWLSYWVVFNSLLLLRQLPFAAKYAFDTPAGNYFMFVIASWMCLPITDGAKIALVLLLRFVNSKIKAIRKPAQLKDANVLFRLMVSMGVLSDQQRRVIESIVMDSGSVILLGMCFIVTPGFITRIGCLLVGYVYPIYAAMVTVKGKSKKPAYWWLTYFIVFAMVTILLDTIDPVFRWVPLWYHARLLMFMWLQLPYFRGAEFLYRNVIDLAGQTTVTDEETIGFMSPHPSAAPTPAPARGQATAAESEGRVGRPTAESPSETPSERKKNE